MDRCAIYVDALRWVCDALAYYLSVREDEVGCVMLGSATVIVRDAPAELRDRLDWARQLRRLRCLSGDVGPHPHQRFDAEHWARVHLHWAKERLYPIRWITPSEGRP